MGIFLADQRYGDQVDMCHLELARSGIPYPSNFRSTKVAVATLRTPLLPLVAQLNECYKLNVPRWFTWCSIQILCPQGIEAMGMHAHVSDGAPKAVIVLGVFDGGEFFAGEWWVGQSLPKGQKGPHPCAQGL